MKKFTALTLNLLLLLVLCACAAEPEEIQNPYRIKSASNEYWCDGEVTGTDRSEYQYNENGMIAESVRYEDGTEVSRSEYEYDEYGNVTRITTYNSDGTQHTDENMLTLDENHNILRMEIYTDGVLTNIEEHTYDTEGKEITSTFINKMAGQEDDSLWVTKTYDRKGNLSEMISKWGFSAAYHKSEYSDEKIIKQTEYSTNDNIVEYLEYTYDDSDNLIKWIRYHGDGSVDNSCERVWDETDLILTELHYDSEGHLKPNKDVFSYDEYGNLLMQERYKDGEVYWRISYTYELIEKEAK